MASGQSGSSHFAQPVIRELRQTRMGNKKTTFILSNDKNIMICCSCLLFESCYITSLQFTKAIL